MSNIVIFSLLMFILLFFLTTFFVKKDFRWFIVIVNIVFICSAYGSTATLLGRDKPLDYSIPFYTQDWLANPPHILGFYVPEDNSRMYFLVKENPVRMYSLAYDEQFIIKLKAAIQRNNGKIEGLRLELKNGTLYAAGTVATIKMPDPPFGDYQKPEVNDGVTDYHTN